MLNLAVSNTDVATSVKTQSGRRGQGKLTCLLMDDSRFDRQMIRRLLTASRFQIELIEATNLAETRSLMARYQPDIILLDYRVPDGDGIDLAREICEQPGAANPAVIVVTGEGDEGSAVRSIRYGAADYLCKDALTVAIFDQALERALASQQIQTTRTPPAAGGSEVARRRAIELRQVRALMLPVARNTVEAARNGASKENETAKTSGLALRALAKVDDLFVEALRHANVGIAGQCDLQEEVRALIDAQPLLRKTVTVLSAAHLPVIRADALLVSVLLEEILSEGIAGVPHGKTPELLLGGLPDRLGEPVLIVDVPSYPAALRQPHLSRTAQSPMTPLDLARRAAAMAHADIRFGANPQGAARTIIRFAAKRSGDAGEAAVSREATEKPGSVVGLFAHTEGPGDPAPIPREE